MSLVIDATLDKAYPTCVVLQGATLQVRRGTVHALVGENGAGKSTLVKLLAGVLAADAGTLRVGEQAIDLATWTRGAARAHGIGIVQQHGASAETLTVVENAVLGVEGGPLLSLAPTARALAERGEQLGLAIDPHARAGDLALGAAQRAEIVAALVGVVDRTAGTLGLLILDEPTAVLAPVEVESLLATLRSLADAGTTIVFVTHKLDEVRAIADDVTVLRAGKTVATFARADAPLDTAAIARAMVGAELPPQPAVPAPAADAPVMLQLRSVTAGTLSDATLAVRAGEIVGVAGIDGNGQSELGRAIAGLVPASGTIELAGAAITRASAAARLRAGLAHIAEDRHHGGLLLDASVADNLVLGRTDITGRWWIDRARAERFVAERIADLDIRPPQPTLLAAALSGGNQQKVVVARELSRPHIRCALAAQPTRGVDLGAVARIHERLRDVARAGAGVLVISADLDELLALCHRIVVLLRGRIVGERSGDELHASDSRAALGALMTGAA